MTTSPPMPWRGDGRALDVRDDARAILQAHYDRQGMEMNAPACAWPVCPMAPP
jgi:hypothetical protein